MDGIVSEFTGHIDTSCSTTSSTAQQLENSEICNETSDIEATTNNHLTNTSTIAEPLVVASSESDEMKRAHAKQLIEKYFYQLSDGCGNPNCTNRNCASSGEVESLTPNQAAARAIQLFSEEAPLCGMPSTKLARITTNASNLTPAATLEPNKSTENTFDTKPANSNDAYR